MNAFDKQREKKQRLIRIAAGEETADVVLKHACYVNVFTEELCYGDIAIADGIIAGIGSYSGKTEYDVSGNVVCPGFIDAHIHLESAAVLPAEFARAVVPHGTTGVVTDPHEMANVMGTEGIDYILQASEGLPLDVYVMLPSCVPATPQDESGARLEWQDIEPFYQHPRVLGLAEVMNFVGVTQGDEGVVNKLTAAEMHRKRVDGHAPDLSGKELNAYIAAGVYSDHESYTYDNAKEKLSLGQAVMIREGTAARNLDALLPLLKEAGASRCLFATDDKHPDDLLYQGHLDFIIRKAIAGGVSPITAVKAASYNTAAWFHMEGYGAIAPGYFADLTVVDNLQDITVQCVFKYGRMVYDGVLQPFDNPKIADALQRKARDTFRVDPVSAKHFVNRTPLAMIGMLDGQIVTTDQGLAEKIDTATDCLKMAVIERHHHTGHIGLGFVKGYGLRQGAVATSISHDSHNLIVIGANEEDMAVAANRVIENRGGIVAVNRGQVLGEVPLPIAGILSDRSLPEVNDRLEKVRELAKELGVNPAIDPFMTLSFMSLSVIPTLRLTTHGVLDVLTQTYK